VLRINPWIGVLASLAYAYATYDPIIIVVGHIHQDAGHRLCAGRHRQPAVDLPA